MFLGIGNDIIEIDRIRGVLQRHHDRFLKRIFTPFEQEYCLKYKDPVLHLAGRFAAKEAIVKALGTGFSQGISWLDIEIRNETTGKPIVQFSSSVLHRFNHPNILISISHCRQFATAVAIYTNNALSSENH